MKQKVQPQKVKRVLCPKCGELQVKIYPYSSYNIQLVNGRIEPCKKCGGQ